MYTRYCGSKRLFTQMCINIHHLLFSAKKNAQKDACRFPYFQKYTQIYVFLLFSIAFIAFSMYNPFIKFILHKNHYNMICFRFVF